ncbi:proline--tRNA ligase [Candidatus Woesebacteria bacterium]|nr:proline--tRNA ligase [Candidatus Woesebacteria bacterium]
MEPSKSQLTKKSEDLSKWYTQVIKRAEIAEYGPVRGTMVIRPYGYAIWENVQKVLNQTIEDKLGAENAYFPLFIPMSLLQKEKTHVEGFSPELAVVTHGGGEELPEPLVVRPTSEAIMYDMYSKWISSWRDLPLKINQWNNVVRWEKRTYFFLRTLEFLWQEGHTAHGSYDEAEEMARAALREYDNLYRDYYALAGISGIKSESEKFAGAHHTYTVEHVMPGGKVLQSCTSHHLGDNFSKAFNIVFQDKNGETKNVQQTSWGLSTRSLGALFLVHGDDHGLVMPPKLAPIKVAIIPILGKKDDEVIKYAEKLKDVLTGAESKFPGKVKIFSDVDKSFGYRINESDLKGISLKIVIGSREVEEKSVTFSSRIEGIEKCTTRFDNITQKVDELLGKIQNLLLEKSEKELNENIHEAKDYEGFKEIMNITRGFIKAFWCEGTECEKKIKEETKATPRLKPIDAKEEKGKCVYCGKDAKSIWYFGQPY